MDFEKVIETYGIDLRNLRIEEWGVVESKTLTDLDIGDLRVTTLENLEGHYKKIYSPSDKTTSFFFAPKLNKDYIVIEKFCPLLLEKYVTKKMQNGYIPCGGIIATKRGMTYTSSKRDIFSQAMYRKGD